MELWVEGVDQFGVGSAAVVLQGVQQAHTGERELVGARQLLLMRVEESRRPKGEFRAGAEGFVWGFIGGVLHNYIERGQASSYSIVSSIQTAQDIMNEYKSSRLPGIVEIIQNRDALINISASFPSHHMPFHDQNICRKMGGFLGGIFINKAMIQEPSILFFIMIMSKGNKRTLQTDSRKGTSPFPQPAEPRLKAKLTIPQGENERGAPNFGSQQRSLGQDRAIKHRQHMEQNQNAVNFLVLKQFMNQSQRQQQVESQDQEQGTMTHKFERVAVENEEQTKKGFNGKVHRAITKQLDRGSEETTRKAKKKRPTAQIAAELPLIPITSIQQPPTTPLPIPSHRPIVEQILQSAPLRERFKGLLPRHLQYSLGFHHKQLLEILRGLDRTIDFRSARNGPKWHFFTDLASNIRENNNGMEVALLHVQQLTFLDPTLYDLDKQFNNKIRQFDLRMKLPSVCSEDQRVKAVKQKIIDFLLAKELQFLAQSGKTKVIDSTEWSEGFKIEKIRIPARALPSDPPARTAQFQHMTSQQLQAVANPQLRNFMQNTKQHCQARSVTSVQMASLILGKKNVKAILDENFRIAQEANVRRQQEAKQQGGVPQKAILSKVCEEIFMIYLAKSVTNMYRKTLVDVLNSKLSTIKANILAQALEFITSAEVGFLEEKKTSGNDLVLQISRDKYNLMREKIQAQPK